MIKGIHYEIQWFKLTITLYRRLFALCILSGGFPASKLESSCPCRVLLVRRVALLSALITTLPRQFLKLPEENKAIPTYAKNVT